MKTITRQELNRMRDGNESFHLVEVLDQEQFASEHISGALNIPLDDNFEEKIKSEIPDRSESVVVYCANTDCPASEQAARKLDSMGYEHVLDYAAGKEDWRQAGLPTASGAPTGTSQN